MLRFRQGDIFKGEHAILVNPVNCVGIMGKGLALQFKLKYPAMFKNYKVCCKRGLLTQGHMHYYTDEAITIINFPTKDHWRNKSELSTIETGLKNLSNYLQDKSNVSVGIPALGCGLGGLSWLGVQRLMFAYLQALDCDITVYTPIGV